MTSTPPSRRAGFPLLASASLAWGFAEATLFFIVPDVVIAWTALRRGWRAGLLAALLAAFGAAAGGVVVYGWSVADPAGAARLIEMLPAIPSGAVARGSEALRREGLAAPLIGSFSGMPYKVWSAAAPDAGWTGPAWFLAAFPVRLPRFALAVAGFALLRTLLQHPLQSRRIAPLFAAGWLVFYAAYWALSPW